MPEMICPFCKKNWPQDFRWCMEDGSELEQNIGQYEMEEDGMPGLECPECGARIDPRDEFCAGCGARLQSAEQARAATEKLSCPKCGNGVSPSEPFCGHCGAPMGEEPAAPDTAAAAPAAAAAAAACPNCGMAVSPGAASCGTCGQMLAAAAPAFAPPPPAYAPPPQPRAAMMMCPQCQIELPEGTDYCHSCGYQFVKTLEDVQAAGAVAFSGMGSCPNCGMEMSPGEAFCGTCGFKLAAAVEPAPTSAPAPAINQTPAAAESCPNCGMAVQPGEVFCGTCGNNLSAAAPPAPVTAVMEPPSAPASAPATGCPTCGMDVMPGETACGTCGQDLTGQSAQYEAAPPPAPDFAAAGSEPVHPDLEVRESLLKLRCKECGSTRTTQGGMFCAVCGAMIGQDDEFEPYSEPAPAGHARSGDLTDPFAPPPDLGGPEEDAGDPFVDAAPANSEQSAPMPSLGDVTGSDLVCPQCGLAGYPGTETCFACGARFVPQSEIVARAAKSLEITEPTPLPIEPEPSYEPEPSGPSLLDITGEQKVCATCGMEAIRGAEICTRCGGSLISAADEIQQTAAQLHAPASEPEQAPQAPDGGDKICSCCGSANPADVEFCAVCGVDF